MLALVVRLLALSCLLLAAPQARAKSCSTKYLRNLHFNMCSEARGKRSADAAAAAAASTGPDLLLASASHRVRKRQVVSLREVLLGSSRSVRHDAPYYPPSFYTTYADHLPVVPPREEAHQPRRRFQSLPQTIQVPDADLNTQEILELFNEMYESAPRSSRMSRDALEQSFKKFVQECCKGATEKCLSNVPCNF